jgi:serine/threonine-protein kinase
VILSRQLAGRLPAAVEAADFSEALTEWLRGGLAPAVEARFADAEAMRQAWRRVVLAERRAEDDRPWWRRLIEGAPEDAPTGSLSDW